MTIANSPPLQVAVGQDFACTFNPTTVTNISSWTFEGIVAINANPVTTPLFTLSLGHGIGFDGTGGVDGVFILSLTAAQTATLSAGVYYYSIWETVSGSTQPLATGQISFYYAGSQ